MTTEHQFSCYMPLMFGITWLLPEVLLQQWNKKTVLQILNICLFSQEILNEIKSVFDLVTDNFLWSFEHWQELSCWFHHVRCRMPSWILFDLKLQTELFIASDLLFWILLLETLLWKFLIHLYPSYIYSRKYIEIFSSWCNSGKF